MAKIVLGAGTSHTPMLTLGSEDWTHRAADDLRNPRLNQSDGTWISYEDLRGTVGDAHADRVTPEALAEMSDICQRALDRLRDEISAAKLDVLIIVGDDQSELFGPENMPVVALYAGDEVVTYDRWSDEAYPAFEGMMARGIDLAVSSEVKDPHHAGFGHAFGFVIRRLLKDPALPTIPLLLNTYYPPNVPTAARCHAIGRALRESIEAAPGDLRVGVIASGGLSHFIVDEALDRRVIEGFSPDKAALLQGLPKGALMSGSSEILNWVLTAGAVDHLPMRWLEYYPVYRTPAGTGGGTAFAVRAGGEDA